MYVRYCAQVNYTPVRNNAQGCKTFYDEYHRVVE